VVFLSCHMALRVPQNFPILSGAPRQGQ